MPPITPPITSAPMVAIAEEGEVRVPKIEGAKFDGNIMNCKTFWAQCTVSINLKPGLTDPEKLAYLHQATRD